MRGMWFHHHFLESSNLECFLGHSAAAMQFSFGVGMVPPSNLKERRLIWHPGHLNWNGSSDIQPRSFFTRMMMRTSGVPAKDPWAAILEGCSESHLASGRVKQLKCACNCMLEMMV